LILNCVSDSSVLQMQFKIKRKLGQGGFGAVFLADVCNRQDGQPEKVAVKYLYRLDFLARFEREILVMRSLKDRHPREFLTIYENGEVDGKPAFVMQLCENGSLEDHLDRVSLAPDLALDLIATIAVILDLAHGHGIIHNDLKPGNILLHLGQLFISDWGAAYAPDGRDLTDPGIAPGTVGFQSPEIHQPGARRDPATDIFALGAILKKWSPHTFVLQFVDRFLMCPRERRSPNCTDLLGLINQAKITLAGDENAQLVRQQAIEEKRQAEELRQRVATPDFLFPLILALGLVAVVLLLQK